MELWFQVDAVLPVVSPPMLCTKTGEARWPKPPWAGDHLDVYKDFVKKVLTLVGLSRLPKPGLSSLVGSFDLLRVEECRCQAAVTYSATFLQASKSGNQINI